MKSANTTTPAVDRAYAHVRRLLQSGLRGSLPSLSRLALESGVSRMSVFKAVTRLRSEGRVETCKGAGVFVAGRSGSASSAPSGVRWQRVTRLLTRDIFTGAFAHDHRLPATKQLCALYAVSHPTMAKALGRLCDEGILSRAGNYCRIVRPVSHTGRNRIVYVTVQDLSDISASNFTALSMAAFYTSLERECAQRNLVLEPVSRRTPGVVRRLAHDRGTLGALFYFLRDGLLPLVKEVAMPSSAAVFDDFVLVDTAMLSIHAKGVRLGLFSIDEQAAGVDMARSLISRGHRSAVFLSPFHRDRYAQLRHEGAVAAFGESGIEGGLELVAGHGTGRNMHRRFIETLKKDRGSGRAFRKVLKEIAWKKTPAVLDEYFEPEEMGWLLNEEFWYAQFEQAHRAVLWQEALPLMETALAHRGATAWICANDAVMFAAHLFLKQRGRSGIALAGFDNTVEAAYNRLTSYSFEIDSIARQILDWIVRRPQDSRLQPPVNEMRMRGKVMVRDG